MSLLKEALAFRRIDESFEKVLEISVSHEHLKADARSVVHHRCTESVHEKRSLWVRPDVSRAEKMHLC